MCEKERYKINPSSPNILYTKIVQTDLLTLL